MLMALVCALQIAAATTAPLGVRVGDRLRPVAVVSSKEHGSGVRADLLAEALGAQLVAESAGRFRFVLAENKVSFAPGSASLRTDSADVALVAAPYVVSGRLYFPWSLVSDMLPRVFSGLMYDDAKRELRRFAMVTAPRTDATTAPPKVAAPSTSSPASPLPTQPNPARSAATSLRHRVVVVDAGHGGPDNGMSGPLGSAKKVREKDITLAVAKALQKALEERGVTVVMTRTKDTLIALHDRGKIANTNKGDLFISVHVNAANPRWKQPAGARGFETYFLAEAKTEDEKRVEAMENESIRFETSAETSADDPLGFIIRDMAQNEHLRESSLLANLVQAQLKGIHPGPSRGVKQAGFNVLVRSFMPAVLVEVGFGSNAQESAYMTNPAKQKDLGAAIANAAVAYLAQYEKKVGPGTP